MKLKTNLHFHIGDDPIDSINYNFFEAVNKAANLGFGAIAVTCHKKFAWNREYNNYAESKNIVLIPGIEQTIEKRHVLILNATKETEKVETFRHLENYKKTFPQAFVIAPHPYFYGNFSLKEKLEQYIHLFDAIEYSWFYSKRFNRNKRGEKIALKYNLPFISTSDTHELGFLDKSYSIIESENRTVESILKAVRERKFENITSPRNFFREMCAFMARIETKNRFKRAFQFERDLVPNLPD